MLFLLSGIMKWSYKLDLEYLIAMQQAHELLELNCNALLAINITDLLKFVVFCVYIG